MITDGPMNVTVCSGTKANISCGYTGVYDAFNTRPNWRIIKRNNNGSVISNETVSGMDIRYKKFDDLKFAVVIRGSNNANGSYLSVGPVDDTYNNTSYQCIFTINDNIIESDTAGTITVIGMYVHYYIIIYTYIIIYLSCMSPFLLFLGKIGKNHIELPTNFVILNCIVVNTQDYCDGCNTLPILNHALTYVEYKKDNLITLNPIIKLKVLLMMLYHMYLYRKVNRYKCTITIILDFLNQVHAWFLNIALVHIVGTLCVCPPLGY